jgi:nicotinate-nucleotide pyrophosphorylase (carboxylating)
LHVKLLSKIRKERGEAAETDSMFDPITLKLNADPLILSALKEDITSDDVSTNSVMPGPKPGTVDLIAKEDGILCGMQIFQRTFQLLDPEVEIIADKQDGDPVEKGMRLAVVRGDIRVLLSGERTALNYLQRMSGIATYTHRMAEKLKGSGIRLLDTRKTTPNNRIFEKYAVTVGGGNNHRYNLSDGVMLKDNHIGAAGGIRQAVEAAREYAPFVRKIEVETETLDMVQEALDAGADIIMLDNMDHAQMEEAVKMIDGRAEIEASGNVTMENLENFRDLGIDYISSGALTHSAPILDLSLKHLRPL